MNESEKCPDCDSDLDVNDRCYGCGAEWDELTYENCEYCDELECEGECEEDIE